jgi:hypothetical protein
MTLVLLVKITKYFRMAPAFKSEAVGMYISLSTPSAFFFHIIPTFAKEIENAVTMLSCVLLRMFKKLTSSSNVLPFDTTFKIHTRQ